MLPRIRPSGRQTSVTAIVIVELERGAAHPLGARIVVGWGIGDHMRPELVVDALQMAVARASAGAGRIDHSDRGSQCVALAFGRRRATRVSPFDGLHGDRYDNAVAASFFTTLKKELVHRREWPELSASRLDPLNEEIGHK
jgi:putative transposase